MTARHCVYGSSSFQTAFLTYFDPWGREHYVASKLLEPITKCHDIICQKKRSSVSYIFTPYAKNVMEYVGRFRLFLRRNFHFRGGDKRNSACLILMGDVCQSKGWECWLKGRNSSTVKLHLLEINRLFSVMRSSYLSGKDINCNNFQTLNMTLCIWSLNM